MPSSAAVVGCCGQGCWCQRCLNRKTHSATPPASFKTPSWSADNHLRHAWRTWGAHGAHMGRTPGVRQAQKKKFKTTLVPDHSTWYHPSAVPSHEVRRFRGRSRPRLIRSARQPAILSSNAEGNRSWHVSTLVIASSTLAMILKGLQADSHSTWNSVQNPEF